MRTTGSNMDEYQQILRLVCQRSIQRNYTLAFYGLPTKSAALPGAALFSSR
ncbi:hypothetical protein SAMN06295905_2203 [Devosia lucknowensis]|uniref:Uncharacterized protein n=1 Tax=Devosia lucknowensis TaxID=1096929 RepID=A0A1Y6FKJ8_9HYPH|nr:hypothetical protein SAMN06295905_2203 [Devosia lucknowensis]